MVNGAFQNAPFGNAPFQMAVKVTVASGYRVKCLNVLIKNEVIPMCSDVLRQLNDVIWWQHLKSSYGSYILREFLEHCESDIVPIVVSRPVALWWMRRHINESIDLVVSLLKIVKSIAVETKHSSTVQTRQNKIFSFESWWHKLMTKTLDRP